MQEMNLDVDTLRTLALVGKHGSFARVAEQLRRSPSAISLQMKKLQGDLGATLFRKSGRNVLFTRQGELALRHAQRVLASNDEMVDMLRGSRARGRLRLGLASDFTETVLPIVLAHVASAYPDLEVEVRLERNAVLRQQIQADHLDLALTLAYPSHGLSYQVTSLPLRWFAKSGWCEDKKKPLPLVVFSAPCLFREHAIEALEKVKRPWRLALESPTLAGLEVAVATGFGVTVRIEHSFASKERHTYEDLPALPNVDVFLHRRRGARQPHILRTAEILEATARASC